MPTSTTTTFEIAVDGAPLDPTVVAELQRLEVDDSLALPDVVTLTFRDPQRVVLGTARLKVGAGLTVKVRGVFGPAPVPLADVEVTALEMDYHHELGTVTVVRAMDRSHRLQRGRKVAAYKQVSRADVARTVISRAGLSAGTVDLPPGTFPHLTQDGVDDWTFLTGLARECGRVVDVAGRVVSVRPVSPASDAPESGDLGSVDPVQLVVGEDVLRLSGSVSATGQVASVQVRGWDPKTKRAVVGSKTAGTSPTASSSQTPQQLATSVSAGVHVVTDTPYEVQAEVDAVAAAIADGIGATALRVAGLVRGNPALRAGTPISIGRAGAPFDGRYTLSATRHLYDAEGYLVEFTATGGTHRSLYALASGGGSEATGTRVHGVVIGIVTSVKDPEQLGRVTLKLPWLSEDYETDWARVVQLGAGKGRGWHALPEVNDEVLVGFDRGDLRRPYVLGGLHGAMDKPAAARAARVDSGTGAVNERVFVSRLGHLLAFDDGPSTKGITLKSADGLLAVVLDQTTGAITVTAGAGKKVTVDAGGDVAVNTQGKATVNATRDLELSGLKVKISGTAGVEIAGGPQVKITGGVVQLN